MTCQGWETEIIITKSPLEMFMNCIGIDLLVRQNGLTVARMMIPNRNKTGISLIQRK